MLTDLTGPLGTDNIDRPWQPPWHGDCLIPNSKAMSQWLGVWKTQSHVGWFDIMTNHPIDHVQTKSKPMNALAAALSHRSSQNCWCNWLISLEDLTTNPCKFTFLWNVQFFAGTFLLVISIDFHIRISLDLRDTTFPNLSGHYQHDPHENDHTLGYVNIHHMPWQLDTPLAFPWLAGVEMGAQTYSSCWWKASRCRGPPAQDGRNMESTNKTTQNAGHMFASKN